MKAFKKLIRPKPAPPAPPPSPIETYIQGGRVPFSTGYWQFKQEYLQKVFDDETLMSSFRDDTPLPQGYGKRLDERVVEYPWLLSRLKTEPVHLMDAGATLIFPYLLDMPVLAARTIVVCTLAPEKKVPIRSNVSYMYGDLRKTLFKDNIFQEIVCISTLEHIGMDNTRIYSQDLRHRENEPRAYRQVLREMWRLMAPGGCLFLTVPFGAYEHLGWMQQFDEHLLNDAIVTFGGQLVSHTFFKYSADGWQIADAAHCAASRYFDVHRTPAFDADFAAAARAVACVVLRKSQ
jgi:hypothetical protein